MNSANSRLLLAILAIAKAVAFWPGCDIPQACPVTQIHDTQPNSNRACCGPSANAGVLQAGKLLRASTMPAFFEPDEPYGGTTARYDKRYSHDISHASSAMRSASALAAISTCARQVSRFGRTAQHNFYPGAGTLPGYLPCADTIYCHTCHTSERQSEGARSHGDYLTIWAPVREMLTTAKTRERRTWQCADHAGQLHYLAPQVGFQQRHITHVVPRISRRMGRDGCWKTPFCIRTLRLCD